MAELQKNTQRYAVQYLLFTWQRNLQELLSGSEQYLRMPVLSSGSWNNVYFTPSRIELSEEVKTTAAGTLYSYTLNAFLPGNWPDLSRMLAAYAGRDHLAMLVFEDGQRVMLGNEFVGARFGYQQSNTARGATLSWQMGDINPIQQVEWQPQFRINAQGMLQQMFGDANIYEKDDQGMFTVIGPDSPQMYLDETKLKQE